MAGNEYNLTLIGLLDRSFDLAPNTIKTFPAESPSARTNAEVCAMAAKIIYENDDLVKEVIQESWNKGILVSIVALKLAFYPDSWPRPLIYIHSSNHSC